MSAGEEPQVSWKVVEAGADVISSEGEKAATVSRVVGDPDADVFTGLAVRVGILSGERLAPSERVTGIWADHVTVDLTKSELEALPEYEEAPVVRLEPEKPGFFARLFGRR
ncbi:MAG TPA: PRC-barrel domain-containing protein [Gaiellaceae bacterium]|nr:PRC-barrel domain-containing protein [Gaiellaceae bacterium]